MAEVVVGMSKALYSLLARRSGEEVSTTTDVSIFFGQFYHNMSINHLQQIAATG